MTNVSELMEGYSCAFPGAAPPRVCRAPGRVNLIGEHLDYNGLPVLPMTVDRDVCVAFAPRADHVVRMRSWHDAFPGVVFENRADIPASLPGSWENYCKAAIAGINDHFGFREHAGMDLFVAGDVPVAAGLSSSSALVVACALAYLDVSGRALGNSVSRIDLAGVLAEAEQYVGTRGGGMDQAIILLGSDQDACKIDFAPLRIEHVPLPRDFVFVVCNTLVTAPKTGAALHRYNAGPTTCRLIRALAERQVQKDFGEEVNIHSLADLWYGPLCLTHGEVREIFEKAFPADRTTLEDAAKALGIGAGEVRRRYIGDLPEPEGGFRLQARARHQLTEYQRVEAARDALVAGDAETFGDLMNASHESCAGDYGVSCPELDALVAIAREAGAIGARLTGAGFGGCTVNLVHRDAVQNFQERVRREYHERYLASRNLPIPPEAILLAHASPGAGYVHG